MKTNQHREGCKRSEQRRLKPALQECGRAEAGVIRPLKAWPAHSFIRVHSWMAAASKTGVTPPWERGQPIRLFVSIR